jgi:deazaflavin-dependent oxidoreductase (nitroreductase family)
MSKTYQVTPAVRFQNALFAFLVRLGINTVGGVSLLTVRGRKSGKPIVTPLAIFVQQGKRYFITPYGEVNWVRNLRAAGGDATLTRSRRTEKIHAVELPPAPAALVFKEAVRTGPPGMPARFVQSYNENTLSQYLNIPVDASLEEYEREVLRHPIFLLEHVGWT